MQLDNSPITIALSFRAVFFSKPKQCQAYIRAESDRKEIQTIQRLRGVAFGGLVLYQYLYPVFGFCWRRVFHLVFLLFFSFGWGGTWDVLYKRKSRSIFLPEVQTLWGK